MRATRESARGTPGHLSRIEHGLRTGLVRIDKTIHVLEGLEAWMRELPNIAGRCQSKPADAAAVWLQGQLDEAARTIEGLCASASMDGVNLITGTGGAIELDLDSDGRQRHVLLPVYFDPPFGAGPLVLASENGPGDTCEALDRLGRTYEQRLSHAHSVYKEHKTVLIRCLDDLNRVSRTAPAPGQDTASPTRRRTDVT